MADVAGITLKDSTTFYTGLVKIKPTDEEEKNEIIDTITEVCNQKARDLVLVAEASALDTIANDGQEAIADIPWGKDVVVVIDLCPYSLPLFIENQIEKMINQMKLNNTLCLLLTTH